MAHLLSWFQDVIQRWRWCRPCHGFEPSLGRLNKILDLKVKKVIAGRKLGLSDDGSTETPELWDTTCLYGSTVGAHAAKLVAFIVLICNTKDPSCIRPTSQGSMFGGHLTYHVRISSPHVDALIPSRLESPFAKHADRYVHSLCQLMLVKVTSSPSITMKVLSGLLCFRQHPNPRVFSLCSRQVNFLRSSVPSYPAAARPSES